MSRVDTETVIMIIHDLYAETGRPVRFSQIFEQYDDVEKLSKYQIKRLEWALERLVDDGDIEQVVGGYIPVSREKALKRILEGRPEHSLRYPVTEDTLATHQEASLTTEIEPREIKWIRKERPFRGIWDADLDLENVEWRHKDTKWG